MLSIAIFWIAIVLIVAGAFFGLLRGFARSFLRFFTVLLTFFASGFICTRLIENPESVLNRFKLLGKLPFLKALNETAPELVGPALSLPVAMAAPIVFTVLFCLIGLLVLIAYAIAAAFIFPKTKKHRAFAVTSHVVGAVIGALQGMVVTLAILLPVVGASELAVDVLDRVEQERGSYSLEVLDKLQSYRDELVEVRESKVYGFVARMGGRSFSNSLMRYSLVSDDGEVTEIALRDETLMLAEIYAHSFPLMKTDFRHFGMPQAEAVARIAQDLSETEALPRLLAGFFGAACTDWKEGNAFLGIKPMVLEGDLATLPTALYEAFDDSTEETVVEDLNTLSELLTVMAQRGLFELIGQPEMIDRVCEESNLNALLACLRSNPRTTSVADELLSIARRRFQSEYLTAPREGESGYTEYRTMLDRIASRINALDPDASAEDRRATLSSGVREELLLYGIDSSALSSAVAEGLSDLLLAGVGSETVSGNTVEALICLPTADAE